METERAAPRIAASRERGLLGAVLLVQLAAVTWYVGRSYFFYDDYLFFSLARESVFDWDYLSRSAFGHFIPSFYAVNNAVARLDPVEYRVAGAILVACHLGCSLLLWRVVRRLVGPSYVALAAMALFGSSIILLNTSLWWSGALCLLPSTLLNLATLAAGLAWDADRRARWLVVVAVAYLGAMTFWEKSLLTAGYLAFLLVLVVDVGLPLQERVAKVKARWPLWSVLAVVGGCYLALYVSGDYASEAPSEDRGIGSSLQFLGLSAFEGLFPGLLGIRYPEIEVLGQVWLGWVAPAVLVAAFAAWTCLRSREARPAWLFFVATYLLNQGVLGFGRLGFGGIHIGREYRYQLDSLFLLLIAGAVALRKALAAPPIRRGRPEDQPRPAWLRPAAAALAAVVLVPLWWRSSDQLAFESPGPDARAYVENFNESLDALRAAGDDRPLLASTVPGSVSTDLFYPYNRHDVVLPLVRSGLVFVTDTSDGLVIDSSGTVVPARFEPLAERQLGEEGCVAPDAPGVDLELDTGPLPVATWFVQIRFTGPVRGVAAVNLVGPDGPKGLLGTLEDLVVDGDEVFASGITTSVEAVQVRLLAEPGSCIASIAIGGVI